MIAYLPDEPLPPEIQELVDDAVAALGSRSMLDRHPAYLQLTAWLEIDDRLNEDVYCGEGWIRALDELELAEGVLTYFEGPDPSPRERVALMRQVLEAGLWGDERYFGLERQVHCAVPLRTSAGRAAVLGCLYYGCQFQTRLTWHGLFRDEGTFRAWLRGYGLLTSVEEFDALGFEDQLGLWDGIATAWRRPEPWRDDSW